MSVEAGTTTKKKSLFGSIKGAFIQELPEVPQQQTNTTSTPAYVAPAAPIMAAPVATQGVVDDSTKQALTAALEANRLDSYDYLKFKSALNELAAIIPDESLRFKTVFTTAKSMVTKEKLVQTANHYVTVLDEELREFNAAVDEQVNTRIVAGEAKVKTLDESVAAKHAQIQTLTDEIAALSQERTALVTKITEDKATIGTRKNNFVTTHQAMVQDIKNDISKVSSYLG